MKLILGCVPFGGGGGSWGEDWDQVEGEREDEDGKDEDSREPLLLDAGAEKVLLSESVLEELEGPMLDELESKPASSSDPELGVKEDKDEDDPLEASLG